MGTGGVARGGWGLFLSTPPEPALLTLCGGGANPPFSLGNALGTTAPVPGLGWGFLKNDTTAEPLDAVSTLPIPRPDTSPAGVELVDPDIEGLSREVVVEVVEVRRGASAGLAFNPACAAAILEATDTGFASSSSSSSGSSS